MRRKRLIVLMIAILLLEAVAAGSIYVEKTRASKETVKKTTKKAQNLKVQSDKSPDDEQKDEESEEVEEPVPDRSAFAVNPAKPAGASEQSEEKVVYLTLDDGPSSLTPQFLELLDKYKVKATFFVTNQNPEYISLIRDAYERGHTIGLHTYSHDYAKIYSSEEAYFADLDQIGKLVQEQIGYVPCFIRFPGGGSNTISRKYTAGIMSALAKDVQTRGYQYYDWNCSSGDGSVQPVENIVANATNCQQNNIVLLSHDANGKETTLEGLAKVIEHYQSLGYTFRALDRDSYAPHHAVNN